MESGNDTPVTSWQPYTRSPRTHPPTVLVDSDPGTPAHDSSGGDVISNRLSGSILWRSPGPLVGEGVGRAESICICIFILVSVRVGVLFPLLQPSHRFVGILRTGSAVSGPSIRSFTRFAGVEPRIAAAERIMLPPPTPTSVSSTSSSTQRKPLPRHPHLLVSICRCRQPHVNNAKIRLLHAVHLPRSPHVRAPPPSFWAKPVRPKLELA